MSASGQTEQYSKRADIFRSSADTHILCNRWALRVNVHFKSNMARHLPTPEQAFSTYERPVCARTGHTAAAIATGLADQTRGGLRGYYSFQPALRRPSSIGAYSTLQYSGGRRRTYMSKDDGELVCSVCSTACASSARPSWPSDAASQR
jgi:hypothetical protein